MKLIYLELYGQILENQVNLLLRTLQTELFKVSLGPSTVYPLFIISQKHLFLKVQIIIAKLMFLWLF